MYVIGQILMFLLNAFVWIIIAQVALSWLIAFDVINVRNAKTQRLVELLNRITDPVYRPLRRFIPAIAGIDITPIIIILGVSLLQNLISRVFLMPAVMGF